MIDPDVQTRRMLVRERHAQLARDAFRAEAPEGVVRETRIRRRRRRAHLSWSGSTTAGTRRAVRLTTRRNRRAPGPAAGSRAPLATAGLPAAARHDDAEIRERLFRGHLAFVRGQQARRCEDAIALDEPQTEP